MYRLRFRESAIIYCLIIRYLSNVNIAIYVLDELNFMQKKSANINLQILIMYRKGSLKLAVSVFI